MVATLRIELFPVNLDASVAFYCDTLGFALAKDDRPHGGRYAAVALGGVRIGLAERPAAPAGDRLSATGVEIVIEVDDVQDARDRIVTAGGVLEDDLQERPWGLVDFRLSDPDGHYLRFTGRD